MGAPKGRIPWNKNLTKETSKILKETGEKISKALVGRTLEEKVGKEKADEIKKVISEKMTGEKHPRYGKHWDVHPRGMLGKHHSEESRKRMSESNKNGFGPDNYCWKGEHSGYYHDLAWKLFGKLYCEDCGISLEEYLKLIGKRFDMHCTSKPKDYSLMEETNWKTFCGRCHPKNED